MEDGGWFFPLDLCFAAPHCGPAPNDLTGVCPCSGVCLPKVNLPQATWA